MSVPDVRFEVIAGVDKLLTALGQRLAPQAIGAFMSKGPVTSHVKERVADRFWREGDAASGAWARLQESTREIRLNTGYTPDHPINERSGELREWAAEGQAGGGLAGTGGWQYVYPNFIPKGDLGDKVATAQRGREKPSTVPRPILALDENDAAVITTLIGRHVTDG